MNQETSAISAEAVTSPEIQQFLNELHHLSALFFLEVPLGNEQLEESREFNFGVVASEDVLSGWKAFAAFNSAWKILVADGKSVTDFDPNMLKTVRSMIRSGVGSVRESGHHLIPPHLLKNLDQKQRADLLTNHIRTIQSLVNKLDELTDPRLLQTATIQLARVVLAARATFQFIDYQAADFEDSFEALLTAIESKLSQLDQMPSSKELLTTDKRDRIVVMAPGHVGVINFYLQKANPQFPGPEYYCEASDFHKSIFDGKTWASYDWSEIISALTGDELEDIEKQNMFHFLFQEFRQTMTTVSSIKTSINKIIRPVTSADENSAQNQIGYVLKEFNQIDLMMTEGFLAVFLKSTMWKFSLQIQNYQQLLANLAEKDIDFPDMNNIQELIDEHRDVMDVVIPYVQMRTRDPELSSMLNT